MAPFFLTKDKVEDRDWGRVEASRCQLLLPLYLVFIAFCIFYNTTR